jgi:uncharacterized protein YukE
MATISDFSSLDHAAIALGDHAHDLRGQVARLQAAAGAVQWRSSAASAFRHRSDEVCASLTQCAAGLDAAALELHHHAATARSRLGDVAGSVLTGVDAVVDTGSAVWHALT